MNTTLAARKYRLGLRMSTEVGRTWGLWFLIAVAAAHAVMFALRALTPFEGELSFYLFPVLPVLTVAIAWVHLARAFPQAIATGMTRKEFQAAYAIFAAVLVLGGVLLTQLILGGAELVAPGSVTDADFYGFAPVESLTRVAVYVAAGAAAGALLARFGPTRRGGALAGLVVGVLLLRQIPLELMQAERLGDGVLIMEIPSRNSGLALVDAILASLFALVALAALAKAPMPSKRG